MKYTNRYGLPEAFVRAVVNDTYSKGHSDFSATGLAEPARASALKSQFNGSLEVDVSTRVAAIIGQGTHSTAERAARPGIDLCEERLFAEFNVDGARYIVSAQLDLFEMDTGVLYDWKTTKAYAFSKAAGGGQKPEWQQQLNVGAEILRRNGKEVKSLCIIALLKDWNKRDAGKVGYPSAEVVSVVLPLWHSSKTVDYIEARTRAHVLAKVTLPLCTSSETWGGRKCGSWCDASSVCEQYQGALKTGIIIKGDE